MGKGLIISGDGKGLYVMKPVHARDHITAAITSLTDEIDSSQEKEDELEEPLEMAELEVAEATIAVNALIDRYEQQIVDVNLSLLLQLHNAERSTPLQGATVLHQAAQAHAEFLAANDRGGHEGAGGTMPSDRITLSGYEWASIAENAAAGPPTTDIVFEEWMKSPGHKANILNNDYLHVGFGYACRNDGVYRHFWVVKFASPAYDPISEEYYSPSLGDPGSPMLCTGDPLDTPEMLREAQSTLINAVTQRSLLLLEMAAISSRKLEAEKRKKELQAIPPDQEQEAWCADATVDLTGEVGTIEIPGEGSNRVLIVPGFNGAGYYGPRDGMLYHREGQSPEQVYFNGAVLPGWQKYKPTYRVGTITAITGTLVSVTLDEETSSAYAEEGLLINQSNFLSNVPVQYMSCDETIFAETDRVVVKFNSQNWGDPVVIGFEEDPRPCWWCVRQVRLDPPHNWRVFYNMAQEEHFDWITGAERIHDGVDPDAIVIVVNGTRVPYYRILDQAVEFMAYNSGGGFFYGPIIRIAIFATSPTTVEYWLMLGFNDTTDNGEYTLEATLNVPARQAGITRRVVLDKALWETGRAYVERPVYNTLPKTVGGVNDGLIYTDPVPLLIDIDTGTEYQNPFVELEGWAPHDYG